MLFPPTAGRLELHQAIGSGAAGPPLELLQGGGRGAAPRFAVTSNAVDLRDLAPPGPLLHILSAIESGDGPLVFLLSREPLPLYPMLARAGWRHSTRQGEQGFELTLERKAAKP